MNRADVKLGFSCNNRCRFCVQGHKRDQYPDRSTESLKAILKAERERCSDVVLTGGEVTVRRDLAELVKYARDLGFRTVQVQTNGRMFASPRYLQSLVDAGVTELSPAIHGADAPTHDGLTRAFGSFKQTVKGVMNARKAGVPVIINSVITRQNMTQLPAMAELFVRLDVQQYQFAFVHALGTAGEHFDEVVPRIRDAAPYIRAGLDVGRRAGVRCLTEAVPLCFLKGYEEHAAEWIIPDTRIVDATRIIEDYTETRRTEGKAKGPGCAACQWDQWCEGPWREYPEHFGWDEFVPVGPPERRPGRRRVLEQPAAVK